MMLILAVIFLLAGALLVMAVRAYRNHLEIRRLERNGCRKLAFRVSNRGCADPAFLRGLAELCVLLLLLAALFGWLSHHAPR